MNRIATLGLALGFACALAGSAAAQVKFGVGGPITGPNAATGLQMKNGVQQAIDDINAAGGILGKKIAVEFGDDVSDPKQGVSVANNFVGDGAAGKERGAAAENDRDQDKNAKRILVEECADGVEDGGCAGHVACCRPPSR